MVRCCVPGCTSDDRDKKGYSFFTFPKKDGSRLKQWLASISRLGFSPTEGCRVCSKHFTEDCFERDLRGELMVDHDSEKGDRRRRRRLKDTAVPTIFPARKPARETRKQPLYCAQRDYKEVCCVQSVGQLCGLIYDKTDFYPVCVRACIDLSLSLSLSPSLLPISPCFSHFL